MQPHPVDPPLTSVPAAGPQAVPGRADWTVDQGWERYTAAEHGVWKTLFERQSTLLVGRACDAYLEGMRSLPIDADAIPDFRRLSEVLMRRTGWEVVAVPGMVPEEVFFEHLAQRRFPAGNFIRPASQLDYLQEPDVFHDVFGHLPMLVNPVMADYVQAYGEGGLRARRLGRLDNLSRLYWYTAEFGLVREHGGLRLYGGGIASSYTESVYCLDDPSPNRIAFDLERVMRTDFRIDDLQETYFVIDGLEQLLELARIDFQPLYDRLGDGPVYRPGDVLPTDTVISRGTGAYRRGRAQAAP